MLHTVTKKPVLFNQGSVHHLAKRKNASISKWSLDIFARRGEKILPPNEKKTFDSSTSWLSSVQPHIQLLNVRYELSDGSSLEVSYMYLATSSSISSLPASCLCLLAQIEAKNLPDQVTF